MSCKSKQDDRSLVRQLKDLMDKMLELDPARRISPKDAMAHPFLRVKEGGGK